MPHSPPRGVAKASSAPSRRRDDPTTAMRAASCEIYCGRPFGELSWNLVATLRIDQTSCCHAVDRPFSKIAVTSEKSGVLRPGVDRLPGPVECVRDVP